MSRRFFLFVLALAVSMVSAFAQSEFYPVASSEAQVVAGKARFTVLTPLLLPSIFPMNTMKRIPWDMFKTQI